MLWINGGVILHPLFIINDKGPQLPTPLFIINVGDVVPTPLFIMHCCR